MEKIIFAMIIMAIEIIILVNARMIKKLADAKAAYHYNPQKDKVVCRKVNGEYHLFTVKNGIRKQQNFVPCEEATCLFSWAEKYTRA